MSERLQEPLPKTICRNEIYYELRGEQYYPCLLVPPEPDASEEDQLRFIIRQAEDMESEPLRALSADPGQGREFIYKVFK